MAFGYLPPRDYIDFFRRPVSELIEWVLGQDNLLKRCQAHRVMSMLRLRPEDRVLELGSGPLYFAGEMARQCHSVVALEYLDQFHHRMKFRRAPASLKAVRGDAQRLPFPDSSFDVVFLSEVLPVLSDPQACLNEVTRVVRPGGRVVTINGKKFSSFQDLYRHPLGRRLLLLAHKRHGTPATFEEFERAYLALHQTNSAFFVDRDGFVREHIRRAGLVIDREEWYVNRRSERFYCWLLLLAMLLKGKPLLGRGQSLLLPVLNWLERQPAPEGDALTMCVLAHRK